MKNSGCTLSTPSRLHPFTPRRAGRLLGALLMAALLAACGGGDAPPPTPTAPAVAVPPTVPLPAPIATDAPLPTPLAATPLAATPLAATPLTATPLAATNGATPVFIPLEVEDDADCPVESHLDLMGYPELEAQLGCAVEEAAFDAIAINEFGDADPTDRFMLWFSGENLIYVLYPDGRYVGFPDTWREGSDPTFPCNPLNGEEASPPLPRRGFGKLWCGDPNLQAVMGAVPREERLCQHAAQQRFAAGRLIACFEDGTVRYFRLLDDGRWDMQVQ
jgi:hypothetical protein